MGVFVVRAFVKLRQMLASNKELAQKVEELERKLQTHDRAIVDILKAIRELMNPPTPARRPIGFTADLEGKTPSGEAPEVARDGRRHGHSRRGDL